MVKTQHVGNLNINNSQGVKKFDAFLDFTELSGTSPVNCQNSYEQKFHLQPKTFKCSSCLRKSHVLSPLCALCALSVLCTLSTLSAFIVCIYCLHCLHCLHCLYCQEGRSGRFGLEGSKSKTWSNMVKV